MRSKRPDGGATGLARIPEPNEQTPSSVRTILLGLRMRRRLTGCIVIHHIHENAPWRRNWINRSDTFIATTSARTEWNNGFPSRTWFTNAPSMSVAAVRAPLSIHTWGVLRMLRARREYCLADLEPNLRLYNNLRFVTRRSLPAGPAARIDPCPTLTPRFHPQLVRVSEYFSGCRSKVCLQPAQQK